MYPLEFLQKIVKTMTTLTDTNNSNPHLFTANFYNAQDLSYVYTTNTQREYSYQSLVILSSVTLTFDP